MSARRILLNAAFAAILLYLGANAIYTGAKALSLPFNGPVEQYLSIPGQDRIAAAVDMARLENDILRPAATLSTLDLVHICHAEICRQFSISEEDATGIDHLLQTGAGVCFDYCGATYALALYVMRTHAHLMDRPKEVRWVRGFAASGDTLASAHSWLDAVGADRRWHGYDAAIDLQENPQDTSIRSAENFLLYGRYVSLSRKQADLGGKATTSLTWSSILLARKNLIEEAVSRLNLPRFLAIPLKAAALLILFSAAWGALHRRWAHRPAKSDTETRLPSAKANGPSNLDR